MKTHTSSVSFQFGKNGFAFIPNTNFWLLTLLAFGGIDLFRHFPFGAKPFYASELGNGNSRNLQFPALGGIGKLHRKKSDGREYFCGNLCHD